MPETALMLLNSALVLAFGICLTFAFAGIRNVRKNFLVFLGLYFFCGIIQLVCFLQLSETTVRKLYPLITHLPLIFVLCLGYHKRLATALTATFTAYLCCQPAKWMGVLFYQITGNYIAGDAARIVCLIAVGYIVLFHVAACLSDIYSKDTRSVFIFGIVPMVYYVFDYTTAVYTNLWASNNRVVAEFLPFFLVVAYMIFCFVYYREYEQKADAQRKEQIIRLAVEQQAKEIKAVKRADQELRMLRHDMRMFLSSLAVSLENGGTETAQEMINAHIDRIEGTKLERYCSNDIINYVLSDYAAKCSAAETPFICAVELPELTVDETLFASVLSNALDNALNAQKRIPPEKRRIKLMLKNSGGKLLLSVKNPVEEKLVFADGLPVSKEKGHGYGTQSIRYMTERMGGNCQFSVQDDVFILRVVV